MEIVRNNATSDCRPDDLYVYLEGELSPEREAGLELHLRSCRSCREELNRAKEMFLALGGRELRAENDIELPEDFAKRVSAAAVNNVTGVRKPREWKLFAAICLLLTLSALAALGGTLREPTGYLTSVFDRIYLLLSMAAYIVYNVAHAVTIFLRPAAGSGTLSIVLACAGMVAAALAFRRWGTRFLRLLKQSE